jgi:hypothetical protein
LEGLYESLAQDVTVVEVLVVVVLVVVVLAVVVLAVVVLDWVCLVLMEALKELIYSLFLIF